MSEQSQKLKHAHNHPLDDGEPLVVVHCRNDAPLNEENPAHAFGPFFSEQEARAFEDNAPDDPCRKIILTLFMPDIPPWRVHNHSPEEGEGIYCKEYRLNGRLVGRCLVATLHD